MTLMERLLASDDPLNREAAKRIESIWTEYLQLLNEVMKRGYNIYYEKGVHRLEGPAHGDA